MSLGINEAAYLFGEAVDSEVMASQVLDQIVNQGA